MLMLCLGRAGRSGGVGGKEGEEGGRGEGERVAKHLVEANSWPKNNICCLSMKV